VEGGAGRRRGCRTGGAAVRFAQPSPPSTALDRPPPRGHPRRICEVCERPGYPHRVSGLSRARRAGPGRGGDPRDLRHVGFHPPDHGAARQGWLRRDRARLAVTPGRYASVPRLGAQAHRGARPRHGHSGSRRHGRVPTAPEGGAGRPHRRDRVLLGRRPELPLRHEQPLALGLRRLLRARPRGARRGPHPRPRPGRVRRERRAHRCRAAGCGRGGPDLPQELPLHGLSRRRPWVPAHARAARGRGQRVARRDPVLQGGKGGKGRQDSGAAVCRLLPPIAALQVLPRPVQHRVVPR